MAELQKIKLRLNFDEIYTQQAISANILISTDSDILKQEKDYQRLIGEKLKSAADWHMRELKSLSIG
ncbi:hypothetical protein GALL_256430 [mine drainage metagenome]|uniref:Uncharacterized protein n=1 Tax=mine drainage metagenome TaxID=410659 RepID=A0A1J5R8S3_9ZZZZ